ncbi:MAG: hypothetical protein ABI597_10730 [Gammaproteobacteria bacterium]
MYKTNARKHARNHEIDLHDDLSKIKAILAETSRDIRGKAGEVFSQTFEDAKEKTTAVKDNLTEYVTDKPLKSLGLAMFTGVVIGFLLRKKD